MTYYLLLRLAVGFLLLTHCMAGLIHEGWSGGAHTFIGCVYSKPIALAQMKVLELQY